MREDRERLADVLEAIDRIHRHAARGREAFEQDELLQTWIVHHLLIIGEACSAMTRELRSAHPQVPWRQITGMRNVLVHNYFNVDHDVVWNVVEHDLTPLRKHARALLEEIDARVSTASKSQSEQGEPGSTPDD